MKFCVFPLVFLVENQIKSENVPSVSIRLFCFFFLPSWGLERTKDIFRRFSPISWKYKATVFLVKSGDTFAFFCYLTFDFIVKWIRAIFNNYLLFEVEERQR